MNNTDKILLALKFELTQKYNSASKNQMNKKMCGLNLIIIFTAEKRGGYAIRHHLLRLRKGDAGRDYHLFCGLVGPI